MPAPTDLLNQDLNRLSSAIEKLTDKVDQESKRLYELEIKITDKLGTVNTKIGSVQTTIGIAASIATLLIGYALYAGRNVYQTVYAEGEKVGSLQAKLDMMEVQLKDHIIRNQTTPTIYTQPPPPPLSPKDIPSNVEPPDPIPKVKSVPSPSTLPGVEPKSS